VALSLGVGVGAGAGGARDSATPLWPTAASQSRDVDTIIVAFERPTKASARAKLVDSLGHDIADSLDLPRAGIRAELIEIPEGQSASDAIARYERDPLVAYAEPNGVWRSQATPNDPHLSKLWGLHNTGQAVRGVVGTADADIDATEAWDFTTGSSNVVVAVVDSGIQYGHPDLAPNIWANPGESGSGKETNGIDDDGNGYVDDWRGWDWTSGSELVPGSGDNDPLDLNGHGTHVAGTIGARGNDAYGVAGVSWDVKLMPLRVLDRDGVGEFWSAAKAFAYAGQKGAHVVNASLGGDGAPQVVSDAIASAPNTLFVVAAGNDASNNDATPQYPCAYTHSNIVCVAASTSHDELSSFSNWGATSVDLAAPGSNVLSTFLPVELLDELDSNADRWTFSGTNNTWSWVSAGGYIADSASGSYANNTDSFATLNETLDLSGSSGCLLTYSMRIDVETDFDFLVPEISIDSGATWEEIHFGWSGTTQGEWFTFVDDIGDWDGEQTVRIRFHLLSDSTLVGAGADIDDVGVHCATSSGNVYGHILLDGTSMATPHVAGAAAALKARRPLATPGQIKNALVVGADAMPALAGKTVTGGRLNLQKSLGLTVPDMPAPASAAPSNRQAIVFWTPPSTDGGTPITGYVVTPFAAGVAQTPIELGNITSTVIHDLANGIPYTFTVRARNAIGDSPPSLPSGAVTPRTVASAPGNVVATAGNAQARITWSASSDNGGSPIMGYFVYPEGGPTAHRSIEVGNVTQTVVGGLQNGTTYRFSVSARNAGGDGPATISNAVTLRGPVLAAIAGVAKVAPAKPKAGRAVTATVRVTAGGAPVRPTKVACTGSIGKAKLKGKPRAAAGSAKCGYKTPRAAKGKRLKGSVSFTARGKRFTKRFSIRLR
jgi:subtilisin family serine protease